MIGGGGVKTLLFCLGTAYNLCSMEDGENLGHRVDNESMPPKIIYLCLQNLELWHLYKSMLPSAKGLSIYVSVESSSSNQKAPIRENLRHFYALLLSDIEYDCDRVFFAMNYNVQSALGL